MAETPKASSSTHPLEKIDPDKCYEWMLAECATLNASRQARQDGLIDTITQISSAAILAIPGFLFASDAALPTFGDSPALYAGVVLFIVSLIAALGEQHYSALAYAKQLEVTQAYYLKESSETHDPPSRRKVRIARNLSYFSFLSAIVLSSIGLFMI